MTREDRTLLITVVGLLGLVVIIFFASRNDTPSAPPKVSIASDHPAIDAIIGCDYGFYLFNNTNRRVALSVDGVTIVDMPPHAGARDPNFMVCAVPPEDNFSSHVVIGGSSSSLEYSLSLTK